MKLKKRYLIPALILVLLLVIRIALPHIVTNYVNRVLNEIPGHRGSVSDVDLHLYRVGNKLKKHRTSNKNT